MYVGRSTTGPRRVRPESGISGAAHAPYYRNFHNPRLERWVAVAVFVLTFLLRLLDPRFQNEHFVFVNGGRQIVEFGELPFRDWIDPGHFLMYFLSAGMLALFGNNLFGEALLSAGLLALGSALTFVLAFRCSSSIWIAIGATLISVSIYPRLYSYYKVFLLALGVFLLWWYADHRRTRDVVVLAIVTGIASMIRQDFGVYFALGSITVLVCVHWGKAIGPAFRQVVMYIAVVAATLLPFFAFLHLNGGVLGYYETAFAYGQGEKDLLVGRVLPSFPVPTVDLTAPLVTIGRGTGGGRLASVSSVNVLPGLLRFETAQVWLYYVCYLTPVLAVSLLAARRVGGWKSPEMMCFEAPKIISAAVFSAAATRVLLAHPSHSRLGDVVPLATILGAWIVATVAHRARLGAGSGTSHADATGTPRTIDAVDGFRAVPGLGRWAAPLALAGVVAVTGLSVVAATRAEFAGDTLFANPVAIARHVPETIETLRTSPPVDAWSKAGSVGLRALVRYVHECTREGDRVLVTSYRPEVFFYSGRGFAGGAPFFQRDQFTSPVLLRQIVDRLREQSVPIVIADAAAFHGQLSRHQPAVYEYLTSRYQVERESSFSADGGDPYLVLIDRDAEPTGVYEPLTLPCFA